MKAALTRRHALAGLSSTAAAGAVALPVTASAIGASGPDLIFAAIEAHRVAWRALAQAVDPSEVEDDTAQDDPPSVFLYDHEEIDFTTEKRPDGTLIFVGAPSGTVCPVYAKSHDDIARNAIRALRGRSDLTEEARAAWIAEKKAELEAATSTWREARSHTAVGRAEAEESRCNDAVDQAEMGLINVIPTTVAGIVALLRYAVEFEACGNEWPPNAYCDKDGRRRGLSWAYFVHRNVADALCKIHGLEA